jgi:catalase-peroxidase
VPAVDHDLIDEKDIADLKGKILASGLSVSQLVSTAWASASPSAAPTSAAVRTGRASVSRRRRTGRSTSRPSLRRCWRPSRHPEAFNDAQSGGKKVSLADLIVLGGCAGVEQAAKKAGTT